MWVYVGAGRERITNSTYWSVRSVIQKAGSVAGDCADDEDNHAVQ